MNIKVLAIGGFMTGLAIGVAGTYFVWKKFLEEKYSEIAEKEIEDARAHYAMLHKRDEFSTPAKAIEKLIPDSRKAMAEAIINIEGYVRPAEGPYIIPVAEFMEAEFSWPQITLTYYTEDDILADEDDSPIVEVEAMVGKDNLKHFGEMSEDSRVVYIQNDTQNMYFEVVLHEGSYAEVVGLTKE